MIKTQAQTNYKSGKISSASFVKRVKNRCICVVIYIFVKLLFATFRVSIQGLDQLKTTIAKLSIKNKSFILTCWHENIVASIFALINKKISILVSSSKDGEIIAWCAHKLGIPSFRGSSSYDGKKALIQLLRFSAQGNSLAISVDGPRGPKRKAKYGAIYIAKKNQIPLVPFSVKASSYWTLKTWDKMKIPKPFSKISINYGEPIFVDPNMAKADILTIAEYLNDKIK